MKTEPMVVVNDFVFCKKHGDEYCNRCFYDHRPTNNYMIQEEPEIAEIREAFVYDFENRESINVYSRGAVAENPSDPDSETCRCRTHNEADCKKCFDWIGYFKEEARKAEAQEKWLKNRERYYRNRDD